MNASTATATGHWVVRDVTGRASRTAHYVVDGKPLCGTNVLVGSALTAPHANSARCATCAKQSTAAKIKETVVSTTAKAAKATVKPVTDQAGLDRLAKAALAAANKANAEYNRLSEAGDDKRAARAGEKSRAASRVANDRAKAAGQPLPFADLATEPEPEVKEGTGSLNADGEVKMDAKPKTRRTPVRKPKAATEPKPEPVLHPITLITMHDGSVAGHKAGCADIAKAKDLGDGEPWTFSVANKREAFLEYNVDFIAEGGEENAWVIDWRNCANHVPATSEQPRTASHAKAKPEPKKATRKAATVAPATKAKAAPKPKPEPKAKVTTEDRNAAKAAALGQAALDAGWSSEIKADGDRLVVTMGRDAEVLTTTFVDGKLDLANMPTYQRGDGSSVLLRNVSAVKKQMDADPDKRPVKAERRTVVRKRLQGAQEDSVDRSRALPFDVAIADLDLVQEHLTGKQVAWRLSDGTRMEAFVGKVIGLKPNQDGTLIMDFIELVASKKAGMVPGPQRTVALAKVTLA